MASPAIVRTFDRMRYEIDESDQGGQLDEFSWFAREYPRCYRFHVNGAEFRLRSVHSLMTTLCGDLLRRRPFDNSNCLSVGLGGELVERVYWDFESLLSEVNVALDLLARVLTPAFKTHAPASFNRMCKWNEQHPLLDLLRAAQVSWVARMKDYRDCFVHYTPVDTLLMVEVLRSRGAARPSAAGEVANEPECSRDAGL